jgi:uncharacterized delta-60 repeat protein
VRWKGSKKMKVFITALILTITICCYSQPAPPVEWIRSHNGSNSFDEAVAMKVDASGNSYVTGRCFINGTEDYCTIKYNTAGVQQWIAYYNGSANISDRPTSLDADGQGNVYVTGFGNYNSGDPFNTGDYCTVKYNSAGSQEWVQIYTAPANKRDYAYKVVADINGNIYVTGASWFDSQRQDDIVTIKYNSSGQVQWTSIHNGTHTSNPSDRGSDMAIDLQGNVYVFGMSTMNSTYTDFCFLKYNSQGVLQFTVYYAGPVTSGIDNGAALSLDNSGNIFVTGTSDGAGTGTDIVTLKYSPGGLEQWSRRYNNAGLDNAADIVTDVNGNVYVSGNKSGKGLILKYNTTGTLEWDKEITGTGGNEIVNTLLVDAAGDVYGTGKIAAGTYFNFVTVKVNPFGVIQWQATHNGSGNQNDFGNAIGMDAEGNVYAAGSSYENGQNGNFCTIKYAPGTIGIDPISTEISNDFSLAQNYPNPFNPVTKIRFNIPLLRGESEGRGVLLIVYNALGKEVKTLVDGDLQSGVYEVDFDGSKLPSGVYFYKLETDGFTAVKKMLLVK